MGRWELRSVISVHWSVCTTILDHNYRLPPLDSLELGTVCVYVVHRIMTTECTDSETVLVTDNVIRSLLPSWWENARSVRRGTLIHISSSVLFVLFMQTDEIKLYHPPACNSLNKDITELSAMTSVLHVSIVRQAPASCECSIYTAQSRYVKGIR